MCHKFRISFSELFLYISCNDPESWLCPPFTVLNPFVFFRDINCDDPDMIDANRDYRMIHDRFDRSHDENGWALFIIGIRFNYLSRQDK